MKKTAFLFISLLYFISCTEQKEIKEAPEQDKYELINIQFSPTFISTSQLIYDVDHDKILFHRLGLRDKLKALPEEKKIVEVFSPKTSVYNVDSVTKALLTDSLLAAFTAEDFKDTGELGRDGVNTFFYITTQHSVYDFEILFPGTTVQYNLIKSLLNICQRQETDSLNLNYLKRLQEYY